MFEPVDLEVDRSKFGRTRVVPAAPSPTAPADGTARLRISSFAVTANNVTYAVAGDSIGYWRFFPAGDDGWGRVPVWGYADIEASSCDDVMPGERFFGFWPMSTHLDVHPTEVGRSAFVDGVAHRADLPAIYNRYQRSADGADVDAEALTSLLQPVFALSFLVDTWLEGEAMFGADTVVLTSASSKTSLGLAHLLSTNGRGHVIGLTSTANAGFVSSVGVYDQVVTYDRLPEGLGEGPAVLVDMAGNADVLATVHRHFGDRLRRSVRVGMTHHDALIGPSAHLDGPVPEFFFAPEHAQRRSTEWGPGGLAERLSAAREGFDRFAVGWIEIDRRQGADAIAAAWNEAVDGVADPRRGVICSW